MADLGFAVNLGDLPEAKDFSPMPSGSYPAAVVGVKLNPTKKVKLLMQEFGFDNFDAYRAANKTADCYLEFEFDVQGDKFAGRKLFHIINVINESEEAQNIGLGQLKQLLKTLGYTETKGWSGKSDELIGKRVLIEVKVEEGKPKDKNNPNGEKYGPSNKCVKFSAPGVSVAAATQATGTTEKKSPWSR